jgi:hypothetical protein
MKALWTLIPASAIYGVIAVLVFRRFTGEAAIRRSVNRVLAHVMELGLFLDSPRLVLRAQRDLLRENLRLLRLVVVPGGTLALLFALLFTPMNAIYGRAPLPVGEPSVVTMQTQDTVQLEAPDGIVLETPGVRVVHDRQMSWRVRPLRQISGDLKFRVNGRVLPARSIEIHYPRATILGLHWLLWFVILSSLSTVMFGLCWKR